MSELEKAEALRAPFPWFGGKSRISHLVWPRFGNVRTYTEPFYGSGAILLSRELELGRVGVKWAPGDTIENSNDLDPYVTNFWRATERHADRVAVIADYPVHEADLHARHQWLVDQVDFRERMLADPDYFDVKIAAWWVWGVSAWIGSGWCCFDGSTRRQGVKRPDLQRNGQGLGVHKKRPHLPDRGGKGVHRQMPQAHSLGGRGVHGHRLGKKRPHLSGNGGGIGIHGASARSRLVPWFRATKHRLRPVRFVCGDFERVCGPSVARPDHGFGAIFFDPPYPKEAERHKEIYSIDCGEVAHRAHKIALRWGEHSRMRVAFCGYEGTHSFPDDWEVVAWLNSGGYGGGRNGRGEANRERERVWFSPACLNPRQIVPRSAGEHQLSLEI